MAKARGLGEYHPFHAVSALIGSSLGKKAILDSLIFVLTTS